MMNSKRSSRYQLVRYLVLGSLAGGLVLLLNYTKAAPIEPASLLPAPTSELTTRMVINNPLVDTVPKPKPVGSSFVDSKNQKNAPIYIVDGKKLSKEEIDKISPDEIQWMTVYKSRGTAKESIMYFDKYGEEAKNGVVVIKLKKNKSDKVPVGVEVHDDKPAARSKNANEPVVVQGYGSASPAKKESVSISSRSGVKASFQEMTKQALVIIDGRPYDAVKDKDLEEHPERINSINVLKGESAVKIYGSRGEKGVIEVNTVNGKAGKPEGHLEEVRIITDTVKVKN